MKMPYLWCLAAVFVAAASCIVDQDERCGERQMEQKGRYVGCVCDPGYVFSMDGQRCIKCGDHEVVRDQACACETGYTRPSSGEACEPMADAAAEDASHADSGAPSGPTGEGTACTTSADCEGLYATYCVTLLPPSTCVIQGCATGERTCPGLSVCCGFDDFAPLASTHGICTPSAMCVSPGKQVNP